MDAIEISRQVAERLHREAVDRGCDPWRPYEFVLAEAHRRDLAVEKVSAGDVRLHGGHALYDPDALLILHEDAGDAFAQAFLVAHEVGHVELGGHAEASVTTTADPARPTEVAPVGIDRVVDYGRRERREVQMDLFAREFLLPRPIARHLHLADGMTASQIADRLQAPFDVIALQLLDALLLPPQVEITSAGGNDEKPLNAEQAKAAAHRGTPYLLEAGPGTGKTQTLVARVGELLAAGIDPSNILILTFSNKAAGELSDRIAAKWPEAAAAAWIGTFHAFGLDIIRRFHDLLGLPPDPRLMDRTEAIELLEEEFARLGLVHYQNLWDPAFELSDILAAISRANDEVVDAERYAELAAAMRTAATEDAQRVAAEQCAEVAAVFRAYEKLKKDRACLDFGDLVSMPVRLCEDRSEVRDHLRSRYQHVLVDEFQDVNRASIRLLQAVAGDGENLWVVGDAKQSIYRFRGASSFNLARFGNDDFPGGERGRLVTNYRSTDEITGIFTAFANAGMKAAAGADVTMKADRGPSGVKAEYRTVDTAEHEIAAVAEAIEEMRKLGFSYRDQALLCSGNERLARIAAGLESLGIPVLYLGSLFERSEVKDLLSLLSLLTDRRTMGMVRVGTMLTVPLSLPDVVTVIRHLRENSVEPLGWREIIDDIAGLTPDGAKSLRLITDMLAGFEPSSNPWEVLARVLLDRTEIAAEVANSTAVAMRARGIAIWQFLNFVRAQPRGSGLPTMRLLERIRRLVILSDERDLRQLPAAAQGIDAVRLMTIHGSKGLEFPVVHFPGLTADTLPRSPNMVRGCAPPDGMVAGAAGSGLDVLKTGHVEEQECLFFVALSRARDRLILYSPTKTANGRNRSRSPFIDRLGTSIDCRYIAPSFALPPAAEDLPIPIELDDRLSVTEHQLGLFQRCPRRFLYTHLIEVGGRRTETAFMKMHTAIQHVVDWLTSEIAVTPSGAEIDARLAGVWDTLGPGEHGYSAEFRRIARTLIGYFIGTRTGFTRSAPEELRLAIAGGEIIIRPDEVLTDAGGRKVVRRVRTGHRTSKEGDDVAAATFKIAAGNAMPGCVVELVHLADGAITPVDMSPKVLANRQTTATDILARIRDGRFPTDPGRTCPRCPAFFICGPVPAGTLPKKSSS
jgi:superfamily I DNA/RNA helicase